MAAVGVKAFVFSLPSSAGATLVTFGPVLVILDASAALVSLGAVTSPVLDEAAGLMGLVLAGVGVARVVVTHLGTGREVVGVVRVFVDLGLGVGRGVAALAAFVFAGSFGVKVEPSCSTVEVFVGLMTAAVATLLDVMIGLTFRSLATRNGSAPAGMVLAIRKLPTSDCQFACTPVGACCLLFLLLIL